MMFCPLTQLACSDARKATIAAMSCGAPIRRVGLSAASRASMLSRSSIAALSWVRIVLHALDRIANLSGIAEVCPYRQRTAAHGEYARRHLLCFVVALQVSDADIAALAREPDSNSRADTTVAACNESAAPHTGCTTS